MKLHGPGIRCPDTGQDSGNRTVLSGYRTDDLSPRQSVRLSAASSSVSNLGFQRRLAWELLGLLTRWPVGLNEKIGEQNVHQAIHDSAPYLCPAALRLCDSRQVRG